MSELQVYFQLGFEHIVATDGLDHILFIAVLAAVYQLVAWRKILILVTAFTIGHSLTLALAALDVFMVDRALVELLIPVTIFITALLNFLEKPERAEGSVFDRFHLIRYGMAVVFGFIHGFAFSGLLRSMFVGTGESILGKLLAFNLGIEVGQILVVIALLSLSAVLVGFLKLSANYWRVGLSAVSGIAAVVIFVFKLVV